MADYTYIAIRQVCEFHEVESHWIDELINFGLIHPVQIEDQLFIQEEELSHLETILRLRIQLGINPPGIETILHMRQTITDLHQKLKELEELLGE